MSFRLRHLLLVCAAVCLVVGTGAFSAASVDRGVSVSVVEDEDAYLGLEIPDELQVASARPGQGGESSAGPPFGTDADTPNEGEDPGAGTAARTTGTAAGVAEPPGQRERTVVLLHVTNRFRTPVDVTVELDAGPGMPRVGPDTQTVGLAVGERAPVDVSVTCPADRPSEVLTLSITAVGTDGGDGVSVTATRQVTVSCVR
ncbi:hypothetical protein [Halomarina litorea]|uniref:hypothetical protein n=1 Tax=Halomarina litorea TaxID=2961595 RepID=UPI0020C49D12|nr:hypothetical protein [Halomarina sp. BCD28]